MATRTKKTPTPEQKAKAEARRESFKALVAEVAQWPEEKRTELMLSVGAVVNCEGRPLSMVNTLLLASQCPAVSMVGGFAQWLAMGRSVKKGEHGLALWIPAGKKKADASEPEMVEEDGDEKNERQRFLMGTVFDISQTTAIESGTATSVSMLRAVWADPMNETTLLGCIDWLMEELGWDRDAAEAQARQHAKRAVEFRAGSGRLAA
jgi:hypothetical protein